MLDMHPFVANWVTLKVGSVREVVILEPSEGVAMSGLPLETHIKRNRLSLPLVEASKTQQQH